MECVEPAQLHWITALADFCGFCSFCGFFDLRLQVLLSAALEREASAEQRRHRLKRLATFLEESPERFEKSHRCRSIILPVFLSSSIRSSEFVAERCDGCIRIPFLRHFLVDPCRIWTFASAIGCARHRFTSDMYLSACGRKRAVSQSCRVR